MREYTATLGNKKFPLRANFSTSEQIMKEVGDPLWMAREATFESMMVERGLPYTPKFAFTVSNIAQIIYIGAKAYNEKVSLSEVQDAIFDAGFFAAKDEAVEYIALIIGSGPDIEKSPLDKEDKETGN